MSRVPVVDIADPTSTSLTELDRACRDHGFFLVSNHGLDQVIANTFRAATQFFHAETTVKDAVRRDAAVPLGYNDRELTKRRRDRKEVFDFVDPTLGRAAHMNRWPSTPPDFQDAMIAHYNAMSALALRVTDLVFQALSLSAETRDLHQGDRTASSVRLNHYTIDDPVAPHERHHLNELANVALGHHTDLGLLTLLIQDDVGGLQALGTDDRWVDVAPQPGTIVVNLADCMQVWTNDQYRAAVHRVLPMTTTERLSIPYFLNPERLATIAPIEELCTDSPVYRPFSFREFIDARSSDNYADLGSEDAQISRYRLNA